MGFNSGFKGLTLPPGLTIQTIHSIRVQYSYIQWFSQRTPIISVHNIHQLFCPTKFQCSLRGTNCIFTKKI